VTKLEQMKFVQQLVGNVEQEIQELFLKGRIPAEWDGHELRELIAEKFAECRSAIMREPRSKRLKDYRNTVLVSNL